MNKRLSWFYRISMGMIFLFILSNISVKAVIWLASPKAPEENRKHPIQVRKQTGSLRYTSEARKRLFDGVDNLLTPALIISFALVAVKLVKIPNIFEEHD